MFQSILFLAVLLSATVLPGCLQQGTSEAVGSGSVKSNSLARSAVGNPIQTEAPHATDAPKETEAPQATDGPSATEAPRATDAPSVKEINSIISANPNILNFELVNAGNQKLHLGFKNEVAGIKSFQKSSEACDENSTISIRTEVNKKMVCLQVEVVRVESPKELVLVYHDMAPNTSYVLRVGKINEKDSSRFIDYPFSSSKEYK